VFHIGIVGHRYLADQETVAFVSDQCLHILKEARSKHPEVVALSAIAEGSDTLFAEAALSLGIPLEIVRPFDDYVADFETPAARKRYEQLRAAAKTETLLAHQERSDAAYGAAMDWIVRKCDLLVIVWDGLPALGPGGTGSAVKEASQLHRAWLHLDVSDFSVKSYPEGNK
jgi:hypothetical protein